jgi:DUF971 family protein
MIPQKIQRQSSSELLIEWNDGHKGRHTMPVLRKYCPCASCKTESESRERSSLLPIITPGQYELTSAEQVGSYAIQLHWGDGHRTGIYTFDYLRQICECADCMKMAGE